MPRRDFRRGAAAIGKRRQTAWIATAPESVFIGISAATALLDSTFVFGQPETIIRVRGLLTIQSDQEAASEQPFGAVGLCVVSDQATAIGVTALPTPYNDAESDLWMMHRFWACPIVAPTAVGITNVAVQYEFDSKAMRKITEDETLCLVIENAHANHAAFYRLDLRILHKVA